MFLVVIDLFCLENRASSRIIGLEPQLGKYLVLDAPRAVVFCERCMQGRQIPLVLNLLEHGIADEIGHRLPREPGVSPYDGCVGIVEPHGASVSSDCIFVFGESHNYDCTAIAIYAF